MVPRTEVFKMFYRLKLRHSGDLGVDLENLLVSQVGGRVNYWSPRVGAASLDPVTLGGTASHSGHVDATEFSQQQILKNINFRLATNPEKI